jgi:hypothetical protein
MRSFFLDAGLEEYCAQGHGHFPAESETVQRSPFLRSMEYLFVLASKSGDWIHVQDPLPKDYLGSLKDWTGWDLGEFKAWKETPHLERVYWEHLRFGSYKESLCKVNSKELSTRISRELGCKDSFVIRDLGELKRVLRGFDPFFVPNAGLFILKEVFGVGGRGKRIFEAKEFFQEATVYAWAKKRLKRWPLILEPFYCRKVEYGTQFWVFADGSYKIFHHNEILATANGSYRGALYERPPIRLEFEKKCLLAIKKVAEHCAALGYSGPCGVDSMEVLLSDQKTFYRPCGEINARWGMGYLGGLAFNRVEAENLVCEWRQIPVSSSGIDISTYPSEFKDWRERLGDLAFNGKEGILILSPSTQKDPLKSQRAFSFLSFASERTTLRDITQAFNASFGVHGVTKV